MLEARLAAEVHNIEDIRTLYRWQGEIHDTHEARAHVRTRRALSQAILERARAAHPYKVPSIVQLEMAALNPRYQQWIARET